MALIRLRRGTAGQWTSVNPVLDLGEPGLETDTNKVKYGDGNTPWNSLSYASGGSGGSGAVASVNGLTGVVVLTKTSIGLNNVDNTSDLGKPISTATQAALTPLQSAQATTVTVARMTPGAALVIDYYKNVFGSANAWPTTRPTTRTDLDVTWRGPTDPGSSLVLAGDMIEFVVP